MTIKHIDRELELFTDVGREFLCVVNFNYCDHFLLLFFLKRTFCAHG